MADIQLMLSSEEQHFLSDLLHHALKEKRVEERRTDAIDYRKEMVHEEDLISSLLTKLGESATPN